MSRMVRKISALSRSMILTAHCRYHSRCLKIARGKIKEDDRFTCPICDWRVKIPRDAARPKLEDLQDWQNEISRLPFQPEEEDTLQEIVNTAQNFRDFIRPYTNPVMTTPEEVTTQRFYLRKIEGAEVLLSSETNFFRQELHKWAPVAPSPPPLLDQSLSTRKPRPTKQQKLMAEHGVTDPADLPPQFRTRQHTFPRLPPRKSSDATSNKSQQPLQPAPQRRNRSDTPHSSSTGTGGEPPIHSHRLSSAMATAHPDAAYTAYMPPGQSHKHGHPESPSFAPGPYFNNSQSRNHHHEFWGSRDFSPCSPIGHSSGPSVEPSLYSPQSTHFAAAMSNGPNDHGHIFSPSHNSSHAAHGMDQAFADFVADPTDDAMNRNELTEQLEDGRQDDDEGETGRFIDDYLNHN